MNEEVQIWYYDVNNGNQYLSTKLVDANHQLKAGETFIRPAVGLLWPIYFSIEKQTWVGTPKQDWVNPRQEAPLGPNAQQRAMAGLMKDVATLKTESQDDSQDKLNAGLMKQIAQLKLDNASQSQVNANLLKQMAQDKLTSDAQLKAQAQINASAMKDIAKLKIALANQASPTQPAVQPTEAIQPTQSQTTNKEEA